jgi:hypothetical protein
MHFSSDSFRSCSVLLSKSNFRVECYFENWDIFAGVENVQRKWPEHIAKLLSTSLSLSDPSCREVEKYEEVLDVRIRSVEFQFVFCELLCCYSAVAMHVFCKGCSSEGITCNATNDSNSKRVS